MTIENQPYNPYELVAILEKIPPLTRKTNRIRERFNVVEERIRGEASRKEIRGRISEIVAGINNLLAEIGDLPLYSEEELRERKTEQSAEENIQRLGSGESETIQEEDFPASD